MLLISLMSCRKDPLPPCYSHASEVKDWDYFKTGTFWVYEEESSGALDSNWVTFSTVYDPFEQGVENSHYYRMDVQSDLGYTIIDHVKHFPLLDSCTPCISKYWTSCFVTFREFNSGNDARSSVGLVYPNHVGSFSEHPFSSVELDTVRIVKDTSFILEGSSCNCIKTYHSAHPFYSEQRAYIFYCKHYGVVRKELLDSNEVWQLKNVNIVQ